MPQQSPRPSRARLILTTPLIATLALAGCTTSASAPTEESSDSFSFTYPTSGTTANSYEALAEAYMEAHPDVTIELNPQPNDQYDTILRTQLQAGNATDLIQTAPGTGLPRSVLSLAEAGLLEPLGEASASVIPAGNESLFELDGATYAQPLDFTVTAFLADTAGAAAAGVSSIPSALDEFLAACRAVAADGKSMVALAGAAAPNTGAMALSIAASRVYAETPDWNEQRIAGDVTFADTDGWSDTLETVLEMKDAGCFQPGAEGAGFDVLSKGFASGTALGVFAPGDSATEIASVAPEAELTVTPFPTAPGGKPYVLASSNYALAISAGASNPTGAQDFLDWLADPEQSDLYAEISGSLPASGFADLDLAETQYAPVADLLSAGDYTPLPSVVWPETAVFDTLATGIQALITGQKTPEQVLEEMDAAWDE